VKIAVLIDGAFLNKVIKKDGNPEKQAHRIVEFAKRCVASDESLYRIFYYDCGPYQGVKTDLAGTRVDFSKTSQAAYQTSLLAHLARQPYVAVRLGILSFDGWKLKPASMLNLRKTRLSASVLTSADFQPDLRQKGVDMRIGLDTALMAMDGLVDRIALVTCDSDFIPAMKLARREGLQVVLVTLSGNAKPELAHHADLYRTPSTTALLPGNGVVPVPGALLVEPS
jgi:uncharacterized LabA/DUF88 family protein